MEKQKYTLHFTILCKDGSKIRESAVTWEDEGLVNAENNIAWRYVVVDNPKAKYKGAIIEFDSGRIIDGSKNTKGKKPLWHLLMQDLNAKGIPVEEDYARYLRQRCRITWTNYKEKFADAVALWEDEQILFKFFDIIESTGAKCPGFIHEPVVIQHNGKELKLPSIYEAKALELARETYERADMIFNEEEAKTVRKNLEELFKKKEEKAMENYLAIAKENKWDENLSLMMDEEDMHFDANILELLDTVIAGADYVNDWDYSYNKDKHDDWDDDPYYNTKEWTYILYFTLNNIRYQLVDWDSEGELRGATLNGNPIPHVYDIVLQIEDNHSLLKPYLQYCKHIILCEMEKYKENKEEETIEEIGARELIRRDDFAHMLHSSLIENKEPQEKHDYEHVLYALKDNGFHVALTDIDPGIKGTHIALLYEDGIAPMITFDITNLPAIKFGRELYKFLALNIKTEESKKVQQMLIDMFSGKQKTTVIQQSETVDNKNGAAAENKAESAVETADKKEEKNMEEKKNVVIPENEYDDLASLDNTITGKTSNDIAISFLIKQKGTEVEAVRNITVWAKKPGDPEYMYKGGVFEGRKYMGYWKWDTRKEGFCCPCFVAKATDVFYAYEQDEAGNPTSNVSRMLKAIAEALTAERGIKSEATYRAKRKGRNTRYVDFTNLSADYDDAPTRIENVRPPRKVIGTAKIAAPAPAPEIESQLPTESEFWGVGV